MAETITMARGDRLRKTAPEPETDVLREGLRVLMQGLMEVAVAAHPGGGAIRAHRGAHWLPHRYASAPLGYTGGEQSRRCWSRALGPRGRWWP